MSSSILVLRVTSALSSEIVKILYASLVLPGYVCERFSLHLYAFEIISHTLLHPLHIAVHVVVAKEGSNHNYSE